MLDRLLPVTLALLATGACATDQEGLDENGKPTLDPTGYQDGDEGKADGVRGRLGPSLGFDSGATQVWKVTRNWRDTDSAEGLAWGANSGLNWDEKISACVDSLERTDKTLVQTTPYGLSFDEPDLDCAQTAMYFRNAFESWY